MTALSEASIPALIEETLASARELASDEVRLTLAVADGEVAALKLACLHWIGAAIAAGAALAWGGLALILALDLGALGAAALASLAFAIAGVALWLGGRVLPDGPFAKTRRRIERRVVDVKEALA